MTLISDVRLKSEITARSLTFELSCKDEMRVGQKNKLTYRWARKG